MAIIVLMQAAAWGMFEARPQKNRGKPPERLTGANPSI
jgi:hypothetical protein